MKWFSPRSPREVRLTLASAFAASALAAPLTAQITTEEAKLAGSAAAGLDFFGGSVALDGDFAAVGSDELSFPNFGNGSVYLFERSGTAWAEVQRIFASDGEVADAFGRSVGLEGDTLVVGADEDKLAGLSVGSVYVFNRNGTVWQRGANVRSSDPTLSAGFGWSIALSGDRFVAGAWRHGPGAAYVFVRSGTTWVEEAKLVPSNGVAGDDFGFTVDIDGDRVIVGARGHGGTGAAYTFVRSGTAWGREIMLTPSGANASGFGISVALDGDRAIVGSVGEIVSGAPTGAAYVYLNAGGWSEEQRLLPPAFTESTGFGRSVDIGLDRAVVGATGEDETGSAHVFVRGDAGWTRRATLRGSDLDDSDDFGHASACDGERVLVSTLFGDGNAATSGSAYVFDVPIPAGSAFCLGDGSIGPCPCGNESLPSSGEGCRNSTQLAGLLQDAGSASVAQDDLSFDAFFLPASKPAMLFAGSVGALSVPFGDGVRCVGGSLVRLGARTTDASGHASWGPGLAAFAGWSAGTTRYFQALYRDPAPTLCVASPGFNLTNGVELLFAP